MSARVLRHRARSGNTDHDYFQPVCDACLWKGALYSNRQAEMRFPKSRDDIASLQRRLEAPLNGSRNLWLFDISDVLRAHGIDH